MNAMTGGDAGFAGTLGRARLVAQGLVGPGWETPTDAVTAFGAMQGQDLPGVLASAALRSTGAIADVIADLDAGRLVRGYPMRGTVFLMPAADAAWITELCAPPTIRAASNRRKELDADVKAAARDATAAALASGPLSRADLFAAWSSAGVPTDEGAGYHLLFHLIAGGFVCYGPWNGTDQDIVLAEGWLPADSSLADRFGGDATAATAELLRRYLTTHGPATLRDFAWWTKLPLSRIRAAFALIEAEFESGPDGAAEPLLWRPGLRAEVEAAGRATAGVLLLPGFDEWVLGYSDRLFAMTADEHARLVPGNNGVFKRAVVKGGAVHGTWTRTGRPGARRLVLDEFRPLGVRARAAADRRFAEFPFAGA
ncbi:MAG: winged helix DNA-binding domain-containing protein [Propionibacteriaceae bacterium]|nr:winged helix DNA-binding domain-containing protein [Propionibacteriaceae bacterium]